MCVLIKEEKPVFFSIIAVADILYMYEKLEIIDRRNGILTYYHHTSTTIYEFIKFNAKTT